jgi:hypothetical protein
MCQPEVAQVPRGLARTRKEQWARLVLGEAGSLLTFHMKGSSYHPLFCSTHMPMSSGAGDTSTRPASGGRQGSQAMRGVAGECGRVRRATAMQRGKGPVSGGRMFITRAVAPLPPAPHPVTLA